MPNVTNMGLNNVNLAVRFILEIVALVAIGIWGWNQGDGWMSFVLGLGMPILVGAIWGIFAVPNDSSRSGLAPIAVPGIVRLLIELAIFTFASWALYDSGFVGLGIVFGILVTIHYIISFDRIIWLMSK